MHIGHAIRHFSSLDSTNSVAAALAHDPANHGLVITASVQTSGRGQYTRRWQAPPGSSILMSILLFPPPELRRPVVLTAWAAVSVCETIRQITGQQAKIKWPNDVLIRGKKVCGILCEGGANHVVAGIGLNVNQSSQDFELMALPDASSLAIITNQSFEVPALTEALIHQLDAEYRRLLEGETTALEADWKWRLGLLGRTVLLERMDGTTITGRLKEMAFDGIVLSSELGEPWLHIKPEMIRHLSEDESNATMKAP